MQPPGRLGRPSRAGRRRCSGQPGDDRGSSVQKAPSRRRSRVPIAGARRARHVLEGVRVCRSLTVTPLGRHRGTDPLLFSGMGGRSLAPSGVASHTKLLPFFERHSDLDGFSRRGTRCTCKGLKSSECKRSAKGPREDFLAAQTVPAGSCTSRCSPTRQEPARRRLREFCGHTNDDRRSLVSDLGVEPLSVPRQGTATAGAR